MAMQTMPALSLAGFEMGDGAISTTQLSGVIKIKQAELTDDVAKLPFCPLRQTSVSTIVSTCAGSTPLDSDASDQDHSSGDEGYDVTQVDQQDDDEEHRHRFSIQALLKQRHACGCVVDLGYRLHSKESFQPEPVYPEKPPGNNEASGVKQLPPWRQNEQAVKDAMDEQWRTQLNMYAKMYAPTKLSSSARPFEPKWNVQAKPFEPKANLDTPTPIEANAQVSSPASRASEDSNKLQASPTSWASQQKARRAQAATGEDAEVTRAMKSILNKLTLEKFDQLYEKLLSCGISTAAHLDILIKEIFEKATMQHGFVSMYGDLCVKLLAHFSQHPITEDPKLFKGLLLKACQASFERHLKAPSNLESLPEEERTNLEQKYKLQMLGNIKFVGALLVRQVLTNKVMVGIIEELFSGRTPLMLELLAALVTVIGPAFDTPEWAGRQFFEDVFKRLSAFSKQEDMNPRVRCLLRDVIELRAARWQERRPKQVEGPSTLKEVADTFAAEEGNASPSRPMQRQISSRSSTMQRQVSFGMETPKSQEQRGKRFEKETCRKEILRVLAELRVSHDLQWSSSRIATLSVPLSHQSEEIAAILAGVAEERSRTARKLCIELLVRLFVDGHWQPSALGKGLQSFLDICADLKIGLQELSECLPSHLGVTRSSPSKSRGSP